jgi:hypothetical protein
MPSANRFSWLRDTVRNHPVVMASSAASAGVLLGGFVAFQLLAPTHPRADGAAAPPAAITAKAEVKPAPETTGSAPASERTASVGCENETWPHLSPRCAEEMRNKNRTRVISTDKLDKPTVTAIEAAPPAVPESKPAASAIASTAPVSPPSSSPPVDLAAAPSAVFAAPDASPAATVAAPAPPAAEAEPKTEKRVATKSNRKPKAETKTIARQETDDDNTPSTTASAANSDSDDRGSYRRVDRRRIVERWTERDYDVPASSGEGPRRVTVIRRNGGGLFESLFGN